MKYFFILINLCFSGPLLAQDIKPLMDAGRKYEQHLKDDSAFYTYTQALAIMPNNAKLLAKMSELSSNKSGRLSDLPGKIKWLAEAKNYAQRAIAADSMDAGGYYSLALYYDNMAALEEKREPFAIDLKAVRENAGKAILANAEYAKAWYMLGKWHYEVLNLNPVKKAAIQLLDGKFKQPDIDSAIVYMEKCRVLDPYFCPNFLSLGQLYNYNKNYEKAINILDQLAKLPTRRQDDVAVKKEGAALRQKLQ